MRLDRTKHNKFATGAIYGNTTSGGITPSSSTATAVGGGGSTVIIQGGGGLTEVSMGMLINVGSWADEVATEDRFLVQTAESNQWVAKPISDIIGTGEDSAYNKLDNSYFDKLFVAIDENGNEIDPNDSVTEIASIKARYGFWTEHFISVKGQNNAEGEIPSGGINEEQLEDYLTTNNYAKKSDIPSLSDWALASTKPSYEFSEIGNKPTTLEGYGITNAYNQEQIDGLLGNKLDVAFFKAMFGLMTEDGEIEPNSEIPTEATIKAKFGLWTEQFLSAKGMNPTDGSVSGIELKDLAGVKINSPQDGEGLVYQNGYWVNQVVQTGEEGNPFYVWQGETTAAPTLNNKPAVDWTTTTLKSEHIDDYYVTTEGLVYQFTLEDGVYSWKLVSDKYLVDCWNKLEQFDDDLTERVEALESGSATTIQPVGTGNVVTEVTKDGTVITVNKGITVYSKAEVDDKVTELNTSLNSEISRAKAAESTLTTNLNNEITRAKNAEATITTNLNNEIARAKEAEKEIDGKLDEHIDLFNSMFQLVTSDGVTSIQAKHGLWTDSFLSAKGANTNGGSSSGGGLIESLYRYADLGKTFADTSNDTFNAYTINKINTDLGSRISVLEGKTTNVSFTQSLTSGTQIGSISIDGVSKNIYAPTIPTSFAWSAITGKPTTISGYGITDALTALTSSADTNLSITVGGTTKSIANLYARYTERFRVVWNNPSEGTYDLNDLLGGYVRAYGSGGTLVNAPESFGHGAILSLTNGTKALSGQLAWNIKHGNTTDVTKNLYWRVSDSANGYTYAKWHQIAFVDEVDTKLSGYLPLSGGTMVINAGIYNAKDSSRAAIAFNETYNGFGSQNFPTYIRSSVNPTLIIGSQTNTLIHSGNIGSQSVSYATSAGDADTLDGMQGSLYKRLKGAENLGASADNLVDLNTTTGFNTYSSTTNASAYISNKPYTNNRGFQMEVMCQLGSSANYVRQMLYAYGTNNIYTRYSNDKGVSWSSWERFAYLTSNVASATKLQTARNIWGQSFNGESDVDGVLYMTNSGATATKAGVLGFDSNTLYVGYSNVLFDVAINGYNNVQLITQNKIGLTLNSSGNVGIGTTSPSYLLDVNGTLKASGAVSFGSTLEVASKITLSGTTASTANIAFSRSSYNYITFPTDGSLCLSTAISTSGIVLRVTSTAIEPMTTATKSVGTSSKRWGAIYGVDGDFSGTLYATTGIYSDGYVSAKGQNTSSDMRLKNVLNDVVLNVSDIANAPSIRFSWKNGGGIDVGSSAQYWQGLLPDAVKERDGILEMQYANIALLSAIAIAKRSENHEERINRLEKENLELRNEITSMQQKYIKLS